MWYLDSFMAIVGFPNTLCPVQGSKVVENGFNERRNEKRRICKVISPVVSSQSEGFEKANMIVTESKE